MHLPDGGWREWPPHAEFVLEQTLGLGGAWHERRAVYAIGREQRRTRSLRTIRMASRTAARVARPVEATAPRSAGQLIKLG